MEALLNLGYFARSDYRFKFLNFKILQSDKVASTNRNNDFQAYLAGLAVSSKNDPGRQKTQGSNHSKAPFHFILCVVFK